MRQLAFDDVDASQPGESAPGGLYARLQAIPGPGLAWYGYSQDTTRAEAAELFRQRYGRAPETVKPGLGMLLAGPV